MFAALFCLIFTVEKCEPPNEPQGSTTTPAGALVRDVFDVETHEQAGDFKEW
jgi:hypothetical protein